MEVLEPGALEALTRCAFNLPCNPWLSSQQSGAMSTASLVSESSVAGAPDGGRQRAGRG